MNRETIEWIVKRCVDSDDDVKHELGPSAKKKRIEVITLDDSPAPKVRTCKQTTPSPQQQKKQELEPPESLFLPLSVPLKELEQQQEEEQESLQEEEEPESLQEEEEPESLQEEEEEPESLQEAEPELEAICSKQTQTDLIVLPKHVSVATQTESLIDSPAKESDVALIENISPIASPNNYSKTESKENYRRRSHYSKSTNRAKARLKDSELSLSCRSIQSRAALNFECISDPNNKMPVNSAGERFNAEYYVRNLYRTQLLNALTNGNVPQGATNPIATAQRIEACIFKQFRSCSRDYRNHMTERSGFLNDSDCRELRLNVVMGRIKPEHYAFMSIDDMDHEKMVELRIATKEAERASCLRDL